MLNAMTQITACVLVFAGVGCGGPGRGWPDESMRYEPKLGMTPLFPPSTEEQIVAFEAELGTSLPDDYRAFLLEWNGVFFKDSDAAFLLKDSEDDDTDYFVTRLYGLKDKDTFDDVRRMQSGYAFNERVPREIIAIGDNNSWNHLCISVSGPDRGAIYLWDPGEPWEPDGRNVPTREWLHPVADNFAEFWQAIYPRPPYEP